MAEAVPMQRTFIAIPLPAIQQQRIADLQQQLRQLIPELKTPRPENLHLTLHFLGHLPQQLLAEISESMLSIGRKKKNFNVALRGLGLFPQRRHPRILWLGLEPEIELIDLYRQLAVELDKLGLQTEQRNYRPHLTIGRFKPPAQHTDALCPFLTHSCGSLQIDKMILFSSQLTKQGAIHSPLTTAPLAA